MRSKRYAIFAFILILGASVAANAQSTAISLSFSGSGINSSSEFLFNGTGTLTPLGQARVNVTGILTGGGATSLALNFVPGWLHFRGGIGRHGCFR